MEISREFITGIKRLGNTSLVSSETFKKLFDEVLLYLENPLSTTHFVDISSSSPRIDIIKESYASFLVLIIEAVRNNVDFENLIKLLNDYNLGEDRINQILSLIKKHKPNLVHVLSYYNSNPPHIYDIKWKMNYCVKSSFTEFDEKILYYIDFTVSCWSNKKNKSKKITFVCTVHQLQSLVANLRSAVRHIEALTEPCK